MSEQRLERIIREMVVMILFCLLFDLLLPPMPWWKTVLTAAISGWILNLATRQ